MNIPPHSGDAYTRRVAANEPSAADEARQEREDRERAILKSRKNPRAKYLGKNGYPQDVVRANEHLTAGKLYMITDCSIGQSHSSVTVKGRSYNSVLFGISVARLIRYFPHRYGYARIFPLDAANDPERSAL